MKSCGVIASILFLVAAQSYAGEKLTLKDAISQAIEKNSMVRAAGFTAAAASTEIDILKSRHYPAVTFEENFAVSNAPTQTFMMKLDQGRFTQNDFQINNLNNPSPWYDFKTSISIHQPLYVPSLSHQKDIAAKDTATKKLELDSIRQDVAFQVFRLYLDIQKSDARLKSAEKSMADARENLRLATVRTAAGAGLRSDELRAKTHLSQVEQQIITVGNNLALAKMRLAMLIGLPDNQSFEISDLTDQPALPLLDEELVKATLQNRLEMKQSRVELEKSDAAVKLARSGYFPTVAAFASYQLNSKDAPIGLDNDAWTTGINLKWPLFEGFRSNHERNRAAANRSAAQELMESRAKDVRYQLKESFLRREESGKRVEVARNALLDAEEAVRLITKRFENSLATMLELLDAQSALNEARASLVDAGAEYTLAGGRIFYAAGTFLKEMQK